MLLEKSKDSSKRDTHLQSQILELKSEIRTLNNEKQKLKRLYDERITGVQNSHSSIEQKCHNLREQMKRLTEINAGHDARKVDRAEKMLKLQ